MNPNAVARASTTSAPKTKCGGMYAIAVKTDTISGMLRTSRRYVRNGREMMVQIDMQKPDHCLRCPLLNDDDMCCLQDYEGQEEKWDWTWEQQMQNCPLKEVDSIKHAAVLPYSIDPDGTLTITVPKGTTVNRVLVQEDGTQWRELFCVEGLFYED